jgi:hypothetical protein
LFDDERCPFVYWGGTGSNGGGGGGGGGGGNSVLSDVVLIAGAAGFDRRGLQNRNHLYKSGKLFKKI